MLATDFHIMDRKVSMGYWKKKSDYKYFAVQHAIPFSYLGEDMWFSLMI